MKYGDMREGRFIERPNRFIAKVDIGGKTETVHVKNTGRCAELLVPGAEVYVRACADAKRKTGWDLIAVRKGSLLVNMDSQAPNKAAREWLEEGHLISGLTEIRPEYTYGNSRIDLYAEAGERRILIEVKGVTLEENGAAKFPDAPSERAVKHVRELARAVKDGYEAYVLFVVQMKGVRYFTPNRDTHPAFAEALKEAAASGVRALACDCVVTEDSIRIDEEIPVVLGEPALYELPAPLLAWYRENRRALPWRETRDPYRIWVSEIMLQQTRVEAVKPYYERFLRELPTVEALAEADEDKLLKLWEGLGYYSRVRNMHEAARQVMIEYHGEFPHEYTEIRKLKGIGDYTAGAVASFAFGEREPAADGNVLRVVARLTADEGDILKQGTKKRMEEELREVIPPDCPGDFNQALIELGALVCVPNGAPRCGECPARPFCEAAKQGRTGELPVRGKKKERKVEKRTILIFRDEGKTALRKRPDKGLLAGLYEFPGLSGHLDEREVTAYCKSIGLMPVRVERLPAAKHIFSHVEWHMIGYRVQVDELEKTNEEGFLFIDPKEIERDYPVPSAFDRYKTWSA